MNQSLPKTENLNLGLFYQLEAIEQSIDELKSTLQIIIQHPGYAEILKQKHFNMLEQIWEMTLNIEDQETSLKTDLSQQNPPYPQRILLTYQVDVAPQYHRLILEEDDEFVEKFIHKLHGDQTDDIYESDFLNRQLRTVKNNLHAREEYLKGFMKEIEETRNEFLLQDLGIEKALNLLDNNFAQIQSGVHYAMRFQEAILPSTHDLKAVFKDCFILNKPKDLVSGDFYWFSQLDQNRYLLGSFDCTGHGVPGAFMSLLGHDLMNEIVHQQKIHSPDVILKTLHHKLRSFLRQPENNNRDGMDAAICLIDQDQKHLEFAGAHNPLLYIQNGAPYLVKGDPRAIGGYEKEGERIFTKHIISLHHPTSFYMFSDGYQDQIGGPNARKFMASRLHRLLFDTHRKGMQKQTQILEKIIDHWMKTRAQLDDILIIGVEV